MREIVKAVLTEAKAIIAMILLFYFGVRCLEYGIDHFIVALVVAVISGLGAKYMAEIYKIIRGEK